MVPLRRSGVTERTGGDVLRVRISSNSADKQGMRANPFLVIVLGLMVAMLTSCSQPSGGAGGAQAMATQDGPRMGNSRFVSATVARKFDASGRVTNDRLTVTEPEELAMLESYFRQAGRGERGPLTGGWVPSVIVTFKPALGREVKVHSNYQVWSEGTGDWPVKGSLKDRVERMFDRKIVAALGE
ncbi:MAG: hypothetical protein H0U59_06040 [Gemmatimonadaceae bacterium]|nr:hypothetical protein [Gemmatimonadaceae bacterium]